MHSITHNTKITSVLMLFILVLKSVLMDLFYIGIIKLIVTFLN